MDTGGIVKTDFAIGSRVKRVRWANGHNVLVGSLGTVTAFDGMFVAVRWDDLRYGENWNDPEFLERIKEEIKVGSCVERINQDNGHGIPVGARGVVVGFGPQNMPSEPRDNDGAMVRWDSPVACNNYPGGVSFSYLKNLKLVGNQDATPKRHPASQRFHDLLKQLGDLHDKKMADYGRVGDPFSNVRGSQEWGMQPWVGAMVRATDKLRRLQKLSVEGKLANEAAIDSFMDLAGYALIGAVLYEEEQRATKK
jgi:hypothetical protein